MAVNGTKSPHKEANRLSTMLRMALGEDRFPIDVPLLALEVSKNNEDPIEKWLGVNFPGLKACFGRIASGQDGTSFTMKSHAIAAANVSQLPTNLATTCCTALSWVRSTTPTGS